MSSRATTTLRQSLNDVTAVLKDRGIPDSRIEAEVLLRHVLKRDRSDFLTLLYGDELYLTSDQSHRLESVLNRRMSGEPLAYIVGIREFYGLELEVTGNVLIPRQETELLVEVSLEFLKDRDDRARLVDVGTGSGAIVLAIAANWETVDAAATDISHEALEVARRNARRLDLEDRVTFVEGDLLEPIQGQVDFIVANPPYIPSGQMESLQTEVRQEPNLALDGGHDGLDTFRRLASQADDKLAPGGALIVELMPEQMSAASELVIKDMSSVNALSIREDLMGNQWALVVENGG